jgi:hypothetical protein
MLKLKGAGAKLVVWWRKVSEFWKVCRKAPPPRRRCAVLCGQSVALHRQSLALGTRPVSINELPQALSHKGSVQVGTDYPE